MRQAHKSEVVEVASSQSFLFVTEIAVIADIDEYICVCVVNTSTGAHLFFFAVTCGISMRFEELD